MHCGSLLLLRRKESVDDGDENDHDDGDDDDENDHNYDHDDNGNDHDDHDDDDGNDNYLEGEAGVDLLELAFARIRDVELERLPS